MNVKTSTYDFDAILGPPSMLEFLDGFGNANMDGLYDFFRIVFMPSCIISSEPPKEMGW
jgi:hypothetical protein